ncbi:hypothetical protein [Gryllotalpicola koreensis]|uniref:hypothetical protein n=1 Tax=Gryllotalpicola koreensis TaxID=993086 RepID=UPI0031DB407A
MSRSGDPGMGDDPEVTAITRRLDRTGDTLGAMNELEQLLIERTGQIPVISPELLAAHSARIERTEALQASAEPEQEQPSDPVLIDWALPARAPLDPAPVFDPWVDPEAIAAAFDADAGQEFTDVSTKVFAVFSAERLEAERSEPEPAPEPQPVPVPALESEDLDELDGIDDLVSAPPPPPAPLAAEPPPNEPAPAEEEPAPKPKRRFWPFGRR